MLTQSAEVVMRSVLGLLRCGILLLMINDGVYAQYAGHVVISEIYGGGGNAQAMYKNDFIELYNPSASPVNLDGWSVQYSAAAGSTWQLTPLSGTIPAFGFFLVQEAKGSGGTVDLPTPDATGSLTLSATAGKVALANMTMALIGSNPTGSSIVDLVGFGATANGYEGAGPAPAPSNINSIHRNETAPGLGNAYDTDNNTSDFSTGAPEPQNSASPIEIDPTPHPVALPRIDFGTGSDLVVAWAAPVGKSDGVIVLMRSVLPVVTTVPLTAFRLMVGANADFINAPDAAAGGFGSAGDKLVYKGSGNSVTVTGLMKNITYHVSILTASGAAWSSGVLRSETALPVELVSFTARARGAHVDLFWSTACERDNAGFAIEKRSTLTEWTQLAFVRGHGTTNAPQQYSYTDVCQAGTYSYRLKQIDRDGAFQYSASIEASIALPGQASVLEQNYPNPFNPSTSIRFVATPGRHVKLTVCTILGQEVAQLFDGIAGEQTAYTVDFNGGNLSGGIYFYILKTEGHREIRKMTLLK
jgi:hypothetical protein